ncbi:MAG: hypothetical protein ACQEUZ_01700 [Pseudomonadota bacterium]
MTRAQVAGITYADRDWIQTWVNRGHIVLEQQNPGTGRRRLYSELDAVRIALLTRLAAYNIPIDRSAELANFIADALRDGNEIDWEHHLVFTFDQMRRNSFRLLVRDPDGTWNRDTFEDVTRDLNDLRFSEFAEWFDARHGASRRDQTGRIDPVERQRLAGDGRFAEPFLVLPYGETVNGTRAMIARLREKTG